MIAGVIPSLALVVPVWLSTLFGCFGQVRL